MSFVLGQFYLFLTMSSVFLRITGLGLADSRLF